MIRLLAALSLLWLAACAAAQTDSSAQKPPQSVAILPPANLAEAADAAPRMVARMRQVLQQKKVELADSAVVAEVLRKHRVRNAAELELAEAQLVAAESPVRYLLLSSLDRYSETDSSAEVALSARLLDVPTATVVWANTVALHRDPRTNFLGIGSHRAEGLADAAVKDLLKPFRLTQNSKRKQVQALKPRSKGQPETPCRRVALVTFGNETETHFAGNILVNELLAAMLKRGFTMVDPGRVREVMLNSQELMQGEISSSLLKKCREDLGADFVLTGTVSHFEAIRGQTFDEPIVAFEARLIDTQRSEPVWAKSYSRDGKDSAWMFNLGYVHGLTVLSERMSRRLASDLPVRRARVNLSVQEQTR
ncbi:MAG TPA: GNA1162 family protein [bacterium]|jgi:hypothetical protein